MRTRFPLLVSVMTLALAAGCSQDAGDPAGPGLNDAAIVMTAFTAGTPIATLVVEVTAADIAATLVFNLVTDPISGVASGTVRVPPGADRLFAVTAFDAGGEVTHDGEALLSVKPGANPPVIITLKPRAGQVPVSVSFGMYSVVVSPGAAVLDLDGVATAQLDVTVTDPNGQLVGDLSLLQWATSAPAIATVNASGFVTGTLAGSATIVATFQGVAGMSAITVVGTASPVDLDGDGVDSTLDCDDTDPTVYPGAVELPDGVDNDCDGLVDEDVPLNETNLAAEADYCVLQFPSSVEASSGEIIQVFGRIFEAGVTEPAGADPDVSMEVGVAASPANDPTLNLMGWTWSSGSFNVQVVNDDEYQATFNAGAPGSYVVAVRFRLGPTFGWTYCDLDGAGSGSGLDWSLAQAMPLAVE